MWVIVETLVRSHSDYMPILLHDIKAFLHELLEFKTNNTSENFRRMEN